MRRDTGKWQGIEPWLEPLGGSSAPTAHLDPGQESVWCACRVVVWWCGGAAWCGVVRRGAVRCGVVVVRCRRVRVVCVCGVGGTG